MKWNYLCISSLQQLHHGSLEWISNFTSLFTMDVIIPLLNEVEGGYTCFTLSDHLSVCLSICLSFHLSICGQNHVRSVSSTILAGSIFYLCTLSSNFRRCVGCDFFFFFFNLKFWQILKFMTLTVSCFNLASNMNWSVVWEYEIGIQYELVWVVIGVGILVVLVIYR